MTKTRFFIIVIFSITEWIANKLKLKQDVAIVAMCLIFVCALAIFKNIRLFGLQYIFYYFLFYSLGYYMNKYRWHIDSMMIICGLGVLWFIMASFWRPRALPYFISIGQSIDVFIMFAYKFGVAFIAVIAMFSIAHKLSLRNENIVSEFGRLSLGIYVFHLTFISLIVEWLKLIIPWNTQLLVIVSFIVAMISSFIAIRLLAKSRCTAELLLGKF